MWIKAFAGALITFLVLDGVWLGVIAKGFYRSELGSLMKDDPNWLAAALFYVAYVAGLTFLAVRPGLSEGDWRVAASHGAVLGLLAYGTYDMTNLATLKGWPLSVVAVDIVWGTLLTMAAAIGGYFAARI